MNYILEIIMRDSILSFFLFIGIALILTVFISESEIHPISKFKAFLISIIPSITATVVLLSMIESCYV